MALTDDLISYYELEETSGSTAADSHGSNDGTYLGNFPNAVSGIIGNAQDTTADGDRINLSSPSNLDDIFDGGGSIAFWMNLDSLDNYSGGGGGYHRHIQKNWWFGGVDISDRHLDLTYPFSGDNGVWRSDGTPISINQDIFIVLTYDNSSTSNDPIFYIDGSSVAISEITTPSGTRTSDAGSDMYFFSDPTGVRTVDGWQDEHGIWDRILSSSEVTELYNSGSGLAYPFGGETFIPKTMLIT